MCRGLISHSKTELGLQTYLALKSASVVDAKSHEVRERECDLCYHDAMILGEEHLQ